MRPAPATSTALAPQNPACRATRPALRPALCLAAALPLGLLPGLAAAQEGPIGWAELLTPDRLVVQMMQGMMMGARTAADIKYSGMSADLRGGEVTLHDVQIWPSLPWDRDGACQVQIARATLESGGLEQVQHLSAQLQLAGLFLPSACLPPPAQGALGAMGRDAVELPWSTLAIDYDIPGAEARLRFFTEAEEFAALTAEADFAYLWLRAVPGRDEPDPAAYLRSASVTIENLGGWAAIAPMLPPPFTAPDQAGQVLSGMIGQGLAQANREASEGLGGSTAEGDPSRLSPAQRAFIDSIAAAWPAFLESPERLVLHTGYDPDEDVWLDFAGFEEHPRTVFDTLEPVLEAGRMAAREVLPAALLRRGLGGETDQLTRAERRELGEALITGLGAPRDRAAGIDLLLPLAEGGDAGAALILAEALETGEPGEAYLMALRAAADTRAGAVAVLDRLEARLPLGSVLALQAEAVGDVTHPVEALERVALMRQQAIDRLSGEGAIRHYGIAALWARLAAAAGDAESRAILDRIDARMARADAEGRAAWAGIEAEAAAIAREAWLGQDLPARFGAPE